MRAGEASDGKDPKTVELCDLSRLRREMVAGQISGRGIADAAVLQAMGRVPREAFVPERLRPRAYADEPLPIGQGQTISQPFIVALVASALRLTPRSRVLEVGTGSGYQAAIFASLAAVVYTVECRPALARRAAAALAAAGFSNVRARCGDGTRGWPEAAPFDAIAVAAAGPRVPPALLQQLALGGRLVMPVGREHEPQRLLRVVRLGADQFEQEDLGGVVFVPLVGPRASGEPAGVQPESSGEPAGVQPGSSGEPDAPPESPPRAGGGEPSFL